jgi:hypothetical protein
LITLNLYDPLLGCYVLVFKILLYSVKDKFGNSSGFELNGKVHVQVVDSAHVNEVPVLVGNTTHLQLSLIKGRATVQVTILMLCLLNNE